MIEALYLHVPFCKTICGYCDFCRFIYNKDKVSQWLDALEFELNDKEINPNLKTIYIGGGTPTCLNSNELERLLKMISPYSLNVEEYTIEVNPETIDKEKVRLLKKYHVNRVSIGVQSSNDELLKIMNRHHGFNKVKEVVKLFKDNGINNISIDLMYGLPKQSQEVLKDTLNDFITLDISHISIYSLTIEEGTAFHKLGYKKMDEDDEADMYDYIIDFLEDKGYRQYEISNFCKPGYESKHNLAYWHYDDFYGISMGASGKEDNVRYDNTKDMNKYLEHNYVDNFIILKKEEAMFEHLMMEFRLKEGFNYLRFNQKYEIDFLNKYQDVLDDLINQGLIVIDGNFIKTSDRGYKILNTVLEYFMK